MKTQNYLGSKCPVLLAAGLGGFFTVVNLALPQDWTITSVPSGYWNSVASSADGAKLVAVGGRWVCSFGCTDTPLPIYTSTNSGVTWTQTTAPTNYWNSVACSADGCKLVAVAEGFRQGGLIYTSSDSGATWVQTSAPTNLWTRVASSADGNKLVAAVRSIYDGNLDQFIDGTIYTSTDSGVTWTLSTAPSNSWTSLASSADGAKLVAAGGSWYNGSGGGGGLESPIYTSTNSGATWTVSSAPSNIWSSVACSADGTKLIAATSGAIYTSTNSGTTWVQGAAPTSSAWLTVASSANGLKLVAFGYGAIAISIDAGSTWTTTSEFIFGDWRCVACSADGDKLVAASSYLVCTSPYSGPWRRTVAPSKEWKAVASSADGTKLVAAADYYGISTSTNSGDTWNQANTLFGDELRWMSISSSSDGAKLVAAAQGVMGSAGPIYTSTNFGETWTPANTPTRVWDSVVSSSDGTKVVALASGSICTSTDSGTTWTQVNASVNFVAQSVASSADGSKLVAVSYQGPSGSMGAIYTSVDSGVTWTQTSAPKNYWFSVASAADGTKLIAVPFPYSGNDTRIYLSTNSGALWTATSAPSSSWSRPSVNSSADGTRLVAIGYDDSVAPLRRLFYTSADSGLTWIHVLDTPADYYWNSSATLSADGRKLVCCDAHIYSLQFPLPPPTPQPSPRLSVSPWAENISVSWLVPSTSFVLQQNSDLGSTNWTDVPTPPALNFTNLHNEVTVSPTDGQFFYRLRHQ